MMEEKYQIQQISGNSESASSLSDKVACAIMEAMGFTSRSGTSGLNIGAVPKEGKMFHVYYAEPEKADDTERYGGRFRLVRQDGEKEETLDQGVATESHYHGGLETMTFYGKGSALASWSFHCIPPEGYDRK